MMLPLIRAHRHVLLASEGHSRTRLVLVPHLHWPRFHEMENRGQEIKISLKDRIAALGLDNQGPATPSSNAFSNTQASFTYGSPATGNSSTPLAGVRDKAARFESIGGVPVPRGSFGLGAPPAQYGPKKSGELYGNRIPSGSRSPGGSPGRSLAEESGDPEFTRIRLRSIKSPDEFKHFEELEVPMAISVIPPTPAFPPPEQVTAPPMETETLSQTPEELSPSIPEDHSSPVLAETTNGAVPELEIPIKASPSTISQELETVPESPNTAPQPAYAKPTIAARRRSAILALEPFTELENGTSSIKEPTTAALPTRSSTLSPGTTARRTRSQASGRGDSISSSSSVFISPPSYQGEISGGGSTSSPTLETMRVSSQSPDNLHAQLVSPFPSSQEIDVTEAALSIIFPDPPHGGTSVANHDSEESPELPTEIITRAPPQISRKDETITEFKSSETGLREVDLANEGVSALIRAEFAAKPLRVHQMSLESASELAYLQSTPPQSLHDHSNVQDDATTLESVHSPVKDVDSPGYRSSSPQSTPSHSQASSELAAETASPARVMRELRQFGMEKQGIIISPPRRASVLSMMLPSPVVTPTDDEPADPIQEIELKSPPPIPKKSGPWFCFF
ncbi:hypothetical protein FRC14_006206 [Serendipita sp. 396]|nr:hypothetical protein FRC14_006206 [Serendipita sp. 396]